MNDFKQQVIAAFEKVAEQCGGTWSIADTFCEISKNNIVLRVRWSIERIRGVFVTLSDGCANQREYGLPYLVQFRGGAGQDLADASSDEPESTAEVVRKYAMDFLEGRVQDFSAFASFAEERACANTAPLPHVRASNRVRPEWI